MAVGDAMTISDYFSAGCASNIGCVE